MYDEICGKLVDYITSELADSYFKIFTACIQDSLLRDIACENSDDFEYLYYDCENSKLRRYIAANRVSAGADKVQGCLFNASLVMAPMLWPYYIYKYKKRKNAKDEIIDFLYTDEFKEGMKLIREAIDSLEY